MIALEVRGFKLKLPLDHAQGEEKLHAELRRGTQDRDEHFPF